MARTLAAAVCRTCNTARRTDTTDAADMKPVEVQGQLLRPGLERLIYMHLPSLACDILASKDPHAKGMTLLTLDQIRRKLPHVWRHATINIRQHAAR